MTRQGAVLDLLQYVGIYGFTAAQDTNVVDGEDDSDIDKAVAAINAALQEMYRIGPSSIKFGSRSAFCNPPTSLQLTMTSGSGGVSATPLAAWMEGCSIQIDGDSVLNRILDFRTSAPYTVTLLRGYTGPNGLHAATVYGDSVHLEDDIAAVLEPVEVAPNRRLRPAQGKSDFNALRYYDQYTPFSQIEKSVGDPTLYYVEQRLDSFSPGGSIYLSLNPMPGAALNLTFDVYRRPETVTRADLDETGGADPGISFVSVPPDMIESIFLPIARYRFLAHPSFRNVEARTQIKTEYETAVQSLRGNSFSPSVASNKATYI